MLYQIMLMLHSIILMVHYYKVNLVYLESLKISKILNLNKDLNLCIYLHLLLVWVNLMIVIMNLCIFIFFILFSYNFIALVKYFLNQYLHCYFN